jgi:hypothetical protein
MKALLFTDKSTQPFSDAFWTLPCSHAPHHTWIPPGTSPAFIREEGQLYEGGPPGGANK